jgi:molybdenum cofactor cytidylyltransferase
MERPIAIEGILLAAGESRRMGFPKPLLEITGTSFLARTANLMLQATSRLIIVLGAHADRIRPAIPDDERVEIVYNAGYINGQLSSLKVGIKELRPATAAVIVHLADHPLVNLATFRAVVREYEDSRKPIVIASYQGRRGHPVLFDRSVFSELLAAPEDQGARVVVNALPGRVSYAEVEDPGTLLDLDTPADLVRAGLSPPPRG